MTLYFSKARGGFYDSAIHGVKGTKGAFVPKDAVPVERVEYEALLAEQSDGKAIVANDAGAPVATVPVLTDEQILANIRRQRDRDLLATDWTQLDAPLSTEQRQAYSEHRQALRDYPTLVAAALAEGQPASSVTYPEPPPIAAPYRPTDNNLEQDQ